MRRFRRLVATISLSCSIIFGLHEAVAQTIDRKTVKKANLKYQSQGSLKKTNLKRIANKKKAVKKGTSSKRTTKANLSAKTVRAAKPRTDIIEPWPVKNAATNFEPVVKDQVQAKSGTTFSGRVDFTVGEDTNIDPDKVGVRDNFFELAPSISFKSRISGDFNMTGTLGVAARDYSEQEISDMAKKTTANASFGAEVNFGQAKSTTTLSGLYNDEMWPDLIDEEGDGAMDGMPIRYVEAGIDQKFSFSLGVMNLDVGGSYTRRDHTDKYSDWANALLGHRRFEQDYNQIKGYSRIGLNAGKHVEFAARPSISQKKYDDRLGRLSDGSTGGQTILVPNYELITNEVALDITFKFLGSTVTPTAMVGQVADQAAGAEDNAYYGYGLTGDIMLADSLKLKLSPKVMYKQSEYDNWTSGTTSSGVKREDKDLVAGVSLSAMFTKNFGASIKYDQIKEKSTKTSSDENYRQQILGTTLTLAF